MGKKREKYFIMGGALFRGPFRGSIKKSLRISKWWRFVWFPNKQGYYTVQRKDGKWALFHIDNPNEPVSNKWFKTKEEFYFKKNKIIEQHKQQLEEEKGEDYSYDCNMEM